MSYFFFFVSSSGSKTREKAITASFWTFKNDNSPLFIRLRHRRITIVQYLCWNNSKTNSEGRARDRCKDREREREKNGKKKLNETFNSTNINNIFKFRKTDLELVLCPFCFWIEFFGGIFYSIEFYKHFFLVPFESDGFSIKLYKNHLCIDHDPLRKSKLCFQCDLIECLIQWKIIIQKTISIENEFFFSYFPLSRHWNGIINHSLNVWQTMISLVHLREYNKVEMKLAEKTKNEKKKYSKCWRW